MTVKPNLADYPRRAHDKLRYADTDRQGHVNNAVFLTFLETGRVELFFDECEPIAEPGCNFVIVRLALDFVGEILWPGTVEIGTRVAWVGRSSITIEQGVFQNDRCVAIAQSVIVLTDQTTRRSRPLSPTAIGRLSAAMDAATAGSSSGENASGRP